MNTILLCKRSKLWEKTFLFLYVELKRSQLVFFNLILVLIFSFLLSTHLLFHLSIWHGLLILLLHTIGNRLHLYSGEAEILQPAPDGLKAKESVRAHTCVCVSVPLTLSLSPSKTGKRGRKQTTENEWNFSALSTLGAPVQTRCNSLLPPTDFSYSLFIKKWYLSKQIEQEKSQNCIP